MWLPRELESWRRAFDGCCESRTRWRTRTCYLLRVQQERLHEPALALDEYILQYQLTPERLRRARPDALVLHPGPMVRGLEIDPAVADGPQILRAGTGHQRTGGAHGVAFP